MTFRPATLEALAEGIASSPRLRVRAGGTKAPLGAPIDDAVTCDLSGYAGIVEYTPEECTFTARAGTPVAEIARALAAHGQWLPSDPPLVEAGATIGGTIASGLNGSCRYRFGGIRDFVIGARIVDGRGRVSVSGGKVVKNAAGFLLHQAMVGSCGRLGVIAEVTCKVFPKPEAFVTLARAVDGLPQGLDAVARLQRARVDLDALDLVHDGRDGWSVVVRLGGFAEALAARVAALEPLMDGASTARWEADDAATWQEAREYAWRPAGTTLVRIPSTLPMLPRLESLVGEAARARRYTVAGNLALVAWPGPLDALDAALRDLGLVGQLILGDPRPAGPFLGAVTTNAFAERLREVLDPDGRF